MEHIYTNLKRVDTMFFQRVKLLLVNMGKNTVVVFSICFESHSNARNRGFGFMSTRLFVPLIDQFLRVFIEPAKFNSHYKLLCGKKQYCNHTFPS